MSNHEFLTGKTLLRFEAIQNCVVPRARKFTEFQRGHSRELVNSILRDKSPVIHFKIRLFLKLIDAVSCFFGFHVFRNLDAEGQDDVLRWFYDSPIPLLRKGFWGVSTLAKLGVYGQNSVYDDIGYHLKETPQ